MAKKSLTPTHIKKNILNTQELGGAIMVTIKGRRFRSESNDLQI